MHQFAHVPPAREWFANIDNQNSRRTYRNDLQELMRFGISAPEDPRLVSRAHVLPTDYRPASGHGSDKSIGEPQPLVACLQQVGSPPLLERT